MSDPSWIRPHDPSASKAELYRGFYLGSLESLGVTPRSLRTKWMQVLRENLKYPLKNHWTPQKWVAKDFALSRRGGLPHWRETQRRQEPNLGLVLIVDVETVDPSSLAAAAVRGYLAADRARRKGGHDFFNEQEYRFPANWCPDVENLRAEFHTSDGVSVTVPDEIRQLIETKRQAWMMDRSDDKRREDRRQERNAIEIGVALLTSGVSPYRWLGDQSALADFAAELAAIEAESREDLPDDDDAEPDYWDENDPETW